MPKDPVHEFRRQIKRLRAFARLLENLGHESAHEERAALGEIARRLSESRDATMRRQWLLDHGFTSPKLAPSPNTTPPPSLKGPQRTVAKIAQRLAHEGHLVSWKPKLTEKALGKSERRLAKARRAAVKSRDEEDFHRWRKRARELLEQAALLELPLAEGKLKKMVRHLGNAQDASVVHASLRPHEQNAPVREAAEGARNTEWKKAKGLPKSYEATVKKRNIRALEQSISNWDRAALK